MTKEFIPYEQALALKELGFDEPCLASWTYKTKERIPTLYGCGALLFDTDGLITNQTEDIICSAPTFHQAFRWFREKHNLIISIERNRKYKNIKRYEVLIDESTDDKFGIVLFRTDYYDTYEEAELECLNTLIKIVKS